MSEGRQPRIEMLRDEARAIAAQAARIANPEARALVDQRIRDLLLRSARLGRDAARRQQEPETPGRQWLKHEPDVLDCYIVRRRFTTDDGEVVRRGEIICPGLGWWGDRPLRAVLLNDGYLVPVTEDTLAWQCPHMRFFATPEALAEHGCADPLSDDEPAVLTSTGSVDLPAGLKGRDRVYAEHWRTGKSASEIGGVAGVQTRTVEKAIVRLRTQWGPEIVPYRRHRR